MTEVMNVINYGAKLNTTTILSSWLLGCQSAQRDYLVCSWNPEEKDIKIKISFFVDFTLILQMLQKSLLPPPVHKVATMFFNKYDI